jgi:hypothetical protein
MVSLRRWWLASFALTGCTFVDLPLEGLGCSGAHPCPAGLQCDSQQVCRAHLETDAGVGDAGHADAGPADAGPVDAGLADAGAPDAGVPDAGPDLRCHLFDDEPPIRCATRVDYWLSPDAGPGADGLSPQTGWATLSGQALASGARVHFVPGDYATPGVIDGLGASGSRLCPVELMGPLDGGKAIVRVPTTLAVSNVWLHDLEIDVTAAQPSLKLPFLDGIRIERVRFHGNLGGASQRDVDSTGTTNLTIAGCEFSSTNSEMLVVSYGDLRFVGNTMVSVSGGQLSVPAGAVIEGNDISGVFYAPSVIAPQVVDGGLVVVRNVFHDITEAFTNPLVVVVGASEVRGNTFANVANGTAATAGRFRDNLVSGLDRGTTLSASEAQAGYNLFDSVTTPYASGTGQGDVMAAIIFEPGLTPPAGSAAIDGADPLREVAPGGGARADIGAVERGATFHSNRRYCMDGGY